MRLGGLSRQRVYQITSDGGFPAPVADLRQGKVWLAEAVEAWILECRPEMGNDGGWPCPP
jgi:predicted DNA-binding transcriptional regulator AlpA